MTERARKQCAKCPWRVDVNPNDIPNGYSVEKHRALSSTIAEPASLSFGKEMQIMACHETDDMPCVGWLINQLGSGNNLQLRLAAIRGDIDANVEVIGEQHATLEETLPDV